MTLPTDVQTQQPATAPATVPGQAPELPTSVVDWEARYKGTAPVIQRMSDERVALTGEVELLKAQLALANSTLTAQQTAAQAQITAATQQADAKGTEAATVLSQKQLLEIELLRKTLLLEPQFQDLAAFEKANVLPRPANATQEMLVEAFTTFKTALGQVKQDSVNAAIGGTTPPAPPTTPGNTAPSKSDLLDQAMAANKRRDYAESDRIMAEIHKLG